MSNSIPPPFAKVIRRPVDGLLLLDKPVGLSSTQAMATAKRLYRAEKAGHTGTLDPFATGLLPIAFGEAAKFSRFMLDADKRYLATLKLGEISRTGDTEGDIIERRPVNVTAAQIDAVLTQFTGAQSQLPPMHSALKQDGVALYKLARQGIDVARERRDITVFQLHCTAFAGDTLVIDTRVSKGTYIRVLAEDIGHALGCGAHLTALRRTHTAGIGIADAHTLESLANLDEAARDTLLLPADALCAALPTITLDTTDARIFSHGGWLPMPASHRGQSGEFRIYSDSGNFLGVGEFSMHQGRERLIPARLMSSS